MRNPTAFLKEEYDEIVKNNLEWKLRRLQSASSGRATVDDKEVIILCSNNYLGLSHHPKLIEASVEATKKYGAGSGSVRALIGNMDLHEQLEDKIASFKHTGSALFYQSGFTVNSGLIPQLVGKEDLVISDQLNHGSIIDGVRLTKAERGIYAHRDMGELEKVLQGADDYRRVLIITDGVFSMDGDLAPLKDIAKLAEQYGAMTFVDDAHGEGVLGDNGRGVAEHFGVEGKIDIEMGTFSKAFGVVGGYAAGNEDLKKFALNKSRTWLLTGSHPPAVVAACTAALEVVETEPEIRKNLWDNTEYFRKAVQDLGFDTGDSESPIIPVMIGDSGAAQDMSAKLFEEGIMGFPIVFPMVAQGAARIRVNINADLTKEELDTSLGAFEKIGKALKVI